VLISNDTNSQLAPVVAYNSINNRYLITWYDKRGGSNFDIYAQKVNADGTLDGISFVVANTADNLKNPSITYNNIDNKYLIAWDNDANIYAQKVNAAGTLDDGVITVCNAANNQYKPDVAYNSSADNEYMVVWEDERNGTYSDIYAQRVNADGTLDGVNLGICTRFYGQKIPAIIYNSTDNKYLITWQDDYDDDLMYQIYGQQISNSGSLIGNLFAISQNAGYAPSIAYNSINNEYLISFYNLGFRGKAQRVNGNGNLIGTDFLITDDTCPYISSLIYNLINNEYLVTWQVDRGATWDIYAQRVDAP